MIHENSIHQLIKTCAHLVISKADVVRLSSSGRCSTNFKAGLPLQWFRWGADPSRCSSIGIRTMSLGTSMYYMLGSVHCSVHLLHAPGSVFYCDRIYRIPYVPNTELRGLFLYAVVSHGSLLPIIWACSNEIARSGLSLTQTAVKLIQEGLLLQLRLYRCHVNGVIDILRPPSGDSGWHLRWFSYHTVK